MKTIISIWGFANIGKTSSIIQIFKKLNYKNTFHEVNVSNEVKAIGYYNNKLIGIESVGDPQSRQGESLIEFAEKDCEIIICASRTKGDTYKNIDNLSKKYGYQIIRTSNFSGGFKGILSNKIDLNDEFSTSIVNLIDKL
ncbi:MAG: hypothetical protein WCG08_08520 [Paludibacter sp.]